MGWEEGQQKKLWLFSFRLFSTITVTILLPLSYLILAKLAIARYFLTVPTKSPPFLVFSFLLYTNPNILCVLSVVSLNALINVLTDQVNPSNGHPGMIFYPRVREACFFLGALQVCLVLGIEGNREAGVPKAVFEGRTTVSKVAMLVGIHETMVCWYQTMVRPVVDAWVPGGSPDETRWVERAALGACFGGLWWWKLKHEVEALAAVVEVNRYTMANVGLSDLLGWWLYYLTLIVGICRISNGVIRAVMFIVCRNNYSKNNIEFCEDKNKHQQKIKDCSTN